ncbi:MAG TPA: hypothetical protein VFI31_15040 [Pirellulales bacterium]|nr:hypothetical protein [Pirellulales bacterium]
MERPQSRRTDKKSKKRIARARRDALRQPTSAWLESLEARHLLSASLALVPVSLAEGTTPTITLGTLTNTNTNLVEGISAITAVSWGDVNHTVTEGNLTPVAGHAGEYTVTGKPQSGLLIVYPEDGSFTATVTVNDLIDPANNTATSTTVTVTEADATLTANNIQAAEGQRFSGTLATLTDPTATANDTFSATINWGDGTSSQRPLSGSGGTYTLVGIHTYQTAGHYTISIAATEAGVSPNPIATATSTADVAENDIVTAALPVSGGEHQQISAPVATFTDPGAVQTFSTVLGNGDVNPYGVAIVPADFPTTGLL